MPWQTWNVAPCSPCSDGLFQLSQAWLVTICQRLVTVMHPLGNCSYLIFRPIGTARSHAENPDNSLMVKYLSLVFLSLSL